MASWPGRKPHPRYLTQFYLMVSIGGALGGLFVALAAPHLFHSYAEMPIAVAGCALLAAMRLLARHLRRQVAFWTRFALPAPCCIFAAYDSLRDRAGLASRLSRAGCVSSCLSPRPASPSTPGSRAITPWWRAWSCSPPRPRFTGYLGRQRDQLDSYYTLSVRNFYGVLRVRDDPPDATNTRRRTRARFTAPSITERS